MQKSISTRIAETLSVLLHPIFIPTYLFIGFMFWGAVILHPLSISQQYLYLLLIFITTALIPLGSLSLYWWIRHRVVNKSSFEMSDREDRVIPFLYVGILYSGITWLFHSVLHPPILLIVVLTTISVGIFVLSLIYLFWKISAHALGWGLATGLIGLLYTIVPDHVYIQFLLTSIIVSGLVMTCRLQLQAHTSVQVYVGWCIGILLSFGGLFELLLL